VFCDRGGGDVGLECKGENAGDARADAEDHSGLGLGDLAVRPAHSANASWQTVIASGVQAALVSGISADIVPVAGS